MADQSVSAQLFGVAREYVSRIRVSIANESVDVWRLQVFACTVGQKPSRAPFYVNDTAEVTTLLDNLARASASTAMPFANLPAAPSPPPGQDVEMMT